MRRSGHPFIDPSKHRLCKSASRFIRFRNSAHSRSPGFEIDRSRQFRAIFGTLFWISFYAQSQLIETEVALQSPITVSSLVGAPCSLDMALANRTNIPPVARVV